MSEVIRFYHKGEPYFEFTNFARYAVYLKGVIWPTTEHYFQAQKYAGTPLEEQTRRLKTPKEVFQAGQAQPARADWLRVRDAVMREAVLAKFTQHPDLGEKLLATGDALLVEHTANDNYWGDGGDGSGQNRLGQILMSVRDQLRQADARTR